MSAARPQAAPRAPGARSGSAGGNAAGAVGPTPQTARDVRTAAGGYVLIREIVDQQRTLLTGGFEQALTATGQEMLAALQDIAAIADAGITELERIAGTLEGAQLAEGSSQKAALLLPSALCPLPSDGPLS